MSLQNLQWNNESEKTDVIREMLDRARLSKMFDVVRGMCAVFGKDGNQFFFIVGDLPEPDCIVGFGDTPRQALEDFYKAFEGS